MSTRAQIGFYATKCQRLGQHNVSLYRHNDGYPDGVLPDILPILARFDKERGLSDVEYAAAWTIHALIQDHVEHLAEIVQRCFTAVIEQFQAADTAEGTESNG